MALQRKNPLPAGMYWQDVFAADQEKFRDWLKRNAAGVKVRSTESYPDSDPALSRDWYKFEVLSPVSWEGPGFPTIIALNETVESSDDTSTAAKVKQDIEAKAPKLEDVLPTPTKVLSIAAAAGVALLVLALVFRPRLL